MDKKKSCRSKRSSSCRKHLQQVSSDVLKKALFEVALPHDRKVPGIYICVYTTATNTTTTRTITTTTAYSYCLLLLPTTAAVLEEIFHYKERADAEGVSFSCLFFIIVFFSLLAVPFPRNGNACYFRPLLLSKLLALFLFSLRHFLSLVGCTK